MTFRGIISSFLFLGKKIVHATETASCFPSASIDRRHTASCASQQMHAPNMHMHMHTSPPRSLRYIPGTVLRARRVPRVGLGALLRFCYLVPSCVYLAVGMHVNHQRRILHIALSLSFLRLLLLLVFFLKNPRSSRFRVHASIEIPSRPFSLIVCLQLSSLLIDC